MNRARRDLVSSAQRCADDCGRYDTASAPDDALDQVALAAEAVLHPWEMREGMKLGGIRRALLRLLLPFVERQHELNSHLALANALLTEEVARLRERVATLEAAAGTAEPGERE